MNQEDIMTIKFGKDDSKSESGKKSTLFLSAEKFKELCNSNPDSNELSVNLEKVSEDSFRIFLKFSFGEQAMFSAKNAIELQYLCKEYENRYFLAEIEEFINQIPEVQKEILLLKFQTDESSIKYVSQNFTKCNQYYDLMDVDPDIIINEVFKSNEFQNSLNDKDMQHALVRYLIKLESGKEYEGLEDIFSDCIKYELLSPADLKDLDNKYKDYSPYRNKVPSELRDSIKTIDDVIKEGNDILENIRNEVERNMNDIQDTIDDIGQQLAEIKQDHEKSTTYTDDNWQKISLVDCQKKDLDAVNIQYKQLETKRDEIVEQRDKLLECFNKIQSKLSDLEAKVEKLTEQDSDKKAFD